MIRFLLVSLDDEILIFILHRVYHSIIVCSAAGSDISDLTFVQNIMKKLEAKLLKDKRIYQ